MTQPWTTPPMREVRRLFRGGRLATEVRRGEAGQPWEPWPDPDVDPFGLPRVFTERFERERTPGADRGEDAAALPFTPLSFRDFMLYERHAIDAARAMVRRYLPPVHAVGTAYERLTRRTFPPFRPARLWYAQPIYYLSNAFSFVPSGTPLRLPSYARDLDYELELGFVINRPLRDAAPAEAAAAIGGYVVVNDVSARDVQLAEMRSGFGPQKAKSFCSSLSATGVPASAVADPADLVAEVRLNGRTVTSTSSRGMRHSLGQALAHASRDEQLYPGELFGTGTLPGGSGLESGTLLTPGDRLELIIHGVGRIEHEILEPGPVSTATSPTGATP